MLQPSNILPNLNFIFGYCSRACPDLKITMYIINWYLLSHGINSMGKSFCSENLLNLLSIEREFYADQFLL